MDPLNPKAQRICSINLSGLFGGTRNHMDVFRRLNLPVGSSAPIARDSALIKLTNEVLFEMALKNGLIHIKSILCCSF